MSDLEIGVAARRRYTCPGCKSEKTWSDGVPQGKIRHEGNEYGPYCKECWPKVLQVAGIKDNAI